jgi:hypothetical protein
MTEADWLNCADPNPLLKFVRGKVSERKLQLFACSCCRRVEGFLKDEVVRKALDAAERFADGRIRGSTVDKWRRKAVKASLGLNLSGDYSPEWLAYQAVVEALGSGPYSHYRRSHLMVTWAIANATGQARGSPGLAAAAWAESAVLSDLLRDIVGNPFRPPVIHARWLRWQSGTVGRLASAIYDERRFAELPILADALEDAGCDNADVLHHCRSGGEHTRGCWVVDWVLNKP